MLENVKVYQGIIIGWYAEILQGGKKGSTWIAVLYGKSGSLSAKVTFV